eukprot:1724451-Rhodomonas_salina.1
MKMSIGVDVVVELSLVHWHPPVGLAYHFWIRSWARIWIHVTPESERVSRSGPGPGCQTRPVMLCQCRRIQEWFWPGCQNGSVHSAIASFKK